MIKKCYWVIALLGLFLVGCGRPAEEGTSDVQRFDVKGVVQSITEDRHSASIKHEAIPGFMMAMTMDFNIKDATELEGISAGDEITFQLVVAGTEHWIENIKRVGDGEVDAGDSAANNPDVEELVVGDLLPDYALTDENGDTVRFSDFQGKVLAFTFIFTRCPIPEYCPLMSNHFAAARKALRESGVDSNNWQFLSISFDPEYDTPEVLSEYAKRYRGEDSENWLFASASKDVLSTLAPELDLMLARDAAGSISHNLRTVVVNSQGQITKQFDNNLWTPEQLVAAMMEVLAKS